MDEMNIFETAPSFPVIPLRGLVMFPDMVLHFDVGRKKSVAALKAAMNADQKIFLVSQKDAAVDEPGLDDLFGVGAGGTGGSVGSGSGQCLSPCGEKRI